jgi:small subunit ribosomal protein S13
LDKESKKNKEMPEDPVDESTGEDEIQDTAEEAVEEKIEELVEEIKEESDEEETKESEATTEQPQEEKKEEKAVETKGKKPAESTEKKEKPQKKEGKSEDFKYIVRISNTDIDGDKNVVYGLRTIRGIGVHMANLIADEAKINKNLKIGDLKDPDIEKLQAIIDKVSESAPGWMLNHRKDYDTGKDIHLISAEIEMRLRDEINIMKKIRSYRGIRHERGLPARGQRTRANNRTGLALGVSKKREIKPSKAE